MARARAESKYLEVKNEAKSNFCADLIQLIYDKYECG